MDDKDDKLLNVKCKGKGNVVPMLNYLRHHKDVPLASVSITSQRRYGGVGVWLHALLTSVLFPPTTLHMRPRHSSDRRLGGSQS